MKNLDGMKQSEDNIEDYILRELSSDDRSTALDFVKYLRNQGMGFVRDTGECWKNKIYYWVTYQEKCICFLAINDPDEPKNRWTVWSDDMRSDILANYPVEDGMKETAWQYVDHCGNCGSCGGGRRRVIFGKEFGRVCGCTFRVDNPDAEGLRFLKMMVAIRKCEIEE